MTLELNACTFVYRKLGDYTQRIYPLLLLYSPKKKRSPNEKHQFAEGAE